MEDNKLLPKLSRNLLEILNDEEYYDITIEVGNDPYVKKNDGTLTHIKLSNISPEIFQIILRYIYGGKLSLNDYDNSDIIKVLVAANELITIIKVEDSNEILGGYNPIEWRSDESFGITKDSFIFSFTNDRIENYILSRVVDEKDAICNCSFYGPSFGRSDLITWEFDDDDNYNYCSKSSYEKSIRKTEEHKRVEFATYYIYYIV
ncbi:BTB/POZ protein [Rhizophagus irregularis DAOM 181602=DAOM 197198]|nr:BTB/POZ protein [Rhizophagus irregularis DAOM 181602=DAOM 197198]